MGCLFVLLIAAFLFGVLSGSYTLAAGLLFLISAMWVMGRLGERSE